MTHNKAAGNTAATTCAGCAQDDWDVRIVRRVGRLENFPLALDPQGPIRRIAVIDTETTGTDPDRDEIIDIAYVILQVDARGEICGIERWGQALRDPGMPIPPMITQLTGITDHDVRGLAVDLDALQAILSGVDACVAHNCSFDAAFLQNLLPAMADAPWACSARDFDWLEAGFDGKALGYLLMQVGFFTKKGHRAMADVISLIHLLAWRQPNEQTVIGTLLANAEQETVRVEANGAGYHKRSVLKARGYRWDPAANVWWIEVSQSQVDDETLWLRLQVLPYGPAPRTVPRSWRQRHR
ncbi:MAG: 3'-5' exonuclease [Sphingobium sp.]